MTIKRLLNHKKRSCPRGVNVRSKFGVLFTPQGYHTVDKVDIRSGGYRTYVDGRTGGGSRPPRTHPSFPPSAIRTAKFSAEKFFVRKKFQPKNFSANFFFGRKFFRPKICSAEQFSGRELFSSKISPSVSPKAEAIGGVRPYDDRPVRKYRGTEIANNGLLPTCAKIK